MKKLSKIALLSLLAVGCVPGGSPDGGMTMPRMNYAVTVNAVHSHIFRNVAVLYTVRDLDDCTDMANPTTCKTVAGLPAVALLRNPGGTETLRQSLEAGKLVDNADGTYTWTHTFTQLGGHMVGLEFEKDSLLYYGAFPYDTSKGGGERYFCDTNADTLPDVAFQIRWNASTGKFLADGTSAIAFSLELQRSFNTPIDTVKPYSNAFNFLTPAELNGGLPTIKLMADKGTASKNIAALTPVYKGRGIYEVKRTFAPADLEGAATRTFWLDVDFTDNAACVVNGAEAEEDFHFPVSKS